MIRSMSQRRLSASSSRGGSAPAVSVAGSAPGGGGGDICSVRGTESRVCPSDDDDPTGVGGGPGDSLGGGGGGVGTGWNSDDEDLEQVWLLFNLFLLSEKCALQAYKLPTLPESLSESSRVRNFFYPQATFKPKQKNMAILRQNLQLSFQNLPISLLFPFSSK